MIKWSIINNFRLSLVHVQDKNNIYIYIKDKYRNNKNVFSWLCILLAMFFVANYRFLVSTLFKKKKTYQYKYMYSHVLLFFFLYFCAVKL
jgi:phosphate starvation-inducible membrane PsiE